MKSFFQFKQFTVHQDRCAMKVCTDACVLGASVAERLAAGETKAESILDIGCGTGLLSLMLAQKSHTTIDAVEIDEGTFLQAKENVAASPWADRIVVHHADILSFLPGIKYDLVICNPPFYENDLKSENASKNIAMHSTALSFAGLAESVHRLLASKGTAILLLPADRVDGFENEMQKCNLFIYEKLHLRHSFKHDAFRSVLSISFSRQRLTETSLLIRNEQNLYSDEFKLLLDDYYLNVRKVEL